MGEFSFPRLVVFCLLPSSRFFEPMSSGRCLLRPSSSVFSLSSPLLLLHLDQPKVEKEEKEENPTARHSFLLSERCSNVLVGFPLGEDLVEDLRRRLGRRPTNQRLETQRCYTFIPFLSSSTNHEKERNANRRLEV